MVPASAMDVFLGEFVMRSFFAVALMATNLYGQGLVGELPIQENVSDNQYPNNVYSIYGWAGEPQHNLPSRPDDNDEINDETNTFWVSQPFVPPLNTDESIVIDCVDGETDIITIWVMIDGKPDIVAKHVNGDDTINWAGVAGENNQQHDHWPNGFGVIVVNGFNPEDDDDRIEVNGHTVAIGKFRSRNPNRFFEVQNLQSAYGPLLDVATQRIKSQQGAGGGAHDEDTLGFIQLPGRTNNNGIVVTNTNSTVGICQTFTEFLYIADYYAAADAILLDDE